MTLAEQVSNILLINHDRLDLILITSSSNTSIVLLKQDADFWAWMLGSEFVPMMER